MIQTFPSFITTFRSKPYIVASGILVLAAIIMTQIPLLSDLGFEFAMTMAVVMAYVIGFMNIHIMISWRSHDQPIAFFPTFFWLGGVSCSTLLFPYLTMFFNSWLSGLCNVLEGTFFYLLLPGITVIWAVAVGMACALLCRKRLYAGLLFIGVTLATYTLGIYRVLAEPPVFVYNPIIGYFPGPIYDEVVRITQTLLIARSIDLVGVIALITGLGLCIDPVTWKIQLPRLFSRYRWPEEAGRSMTRVVCLMACLFLVAAYLYRAPLGLVIDRDYIQQTLGGHRQTAHFDIYYDINAATGRHVDLMAKDHEYQFAQLLDFLDIDPPEQRIRSYIYTSADQKKRLMGARYTSLERPGDDEMHLNDADFPHPVMKHELAHVLSASFGNALYGGSYKMGFHEGMAVAADWRGDRLTAHQWSRAMRELGLAPPLASIIGTFGFWTSASSRSYTLCGSFVRFLIDRYGVTAFKKAFPDGAVDIAYGQELPVLIRQWETYIDNLVLSEDALRIARQRFLQPSIFQRHCPHEVAALNDQAWQAYQSRRYPEAIRLFDQVRMLEPDNPSSLRGLLYAAYRNKAYSRADTLSAYMLAKPGQVVGLLTDAYLIQGDLSWKRRDVARARERYEQALALHGSDRVDREVLVKLNTLEQADVRDGVFDYLMAGGNQTAQVMLVREAIASVPDFATGYYLVGRRLYLTETYVQAIPYLVQADSLSLPAPLLQQENLRLLGRCYFYEGAYDQAIEIFQRLSEHASSVWMRGQAQEWIRRCLWFSENAG